MPRPPARRRPAHPRAPRVSLASLASLASLVWAGLAASTAAAQPPAAPRDSAAAPAPVVAAFRAWVRAHGHPLRVADADTAADRLGDLAPLAAVVGDARVIALGEPFHGGHEPLVLRNRVARYCVLALRCTAVALETGLAPSEALDAYVQGRTPADDPAASDSALARAFTYGFGRLRENLELLHWLRAHNAARPPAERVRVYGVDLTGQVFPTAHRALEAVFAYLDRADPALARGVRARDGALVARFRSDTFPELAAAERDRVAGRVVDLVALLRARRPALTAAAGGDAYEWALRQAVNAEQDLAFLRRTPAGFWARFRARALTPADSFAATRPLREAAVADNVAWVLARERARAAGRGGRVLVFAHDMHLQGHAFRGEGPVAGLLAGVEPAGMHLRAMLGRDLVVLATHFGRAEGFPAASAPLPPDPAGAEAVLAAPGLPAYLADLRRLPAGGPLRAWASRAHAVRGGDAGDAREWVRPALAADALVYVDRVSRARLTPP
jgi:erythromycin esterase